MMRLKIFLFSLHRQQDFKMGEVCPRDFLPEHHRLLGWAPTWFGLGGKKGRKRLSQTSPKCGGFVDCFYSTLYPTFNQLLKARHSDFPPTCAFPCRCFSALNSPLFTCSPPSLRKEAFGSAVRLLPAVSRLESHPISCTHTHTVMQREKAKGRERKRERGRAPHTTREPHQLEVE